ncbi:MAG: hypothetical protein Q9P14_19185 [candidate division KSB1 bacterium]|nr:hypothetical protein [candidate division KSB1 bacterium]MDQ7063135.1 hypothetical protein [candidate division KSB1 bacterium]
MKSIIGFLAFWLLVSGCWSNKSAEQGRPAVQPSEQSQHKVYIDDVEVLQQKAGTHEVLIRVRGNLPNPAYRITDYRISIDKGQITIIPDVTYDKDAMVVQVLVPFEDTLTVKLQKPGEYKIYLEGRSKAVVKKLQLQE